MKFAMYLTVPTLLLAAIGLARNAEDASSSPCCSATFALHVDSATTAPAAKVDAQKAFEQLSKLVGTWKMVADGGPGDGSIIEFKMTAAGSVVMETMFPGTDHEMVNLYAIDGEDLLVTHYCGAGNQPRMKLVSADNGVLAFEFKDATNLASPQDMYMGGLKLIVADGKLAEEWTHFDKGKVAGSMTFDLVR